ncbi:MAG: glycosyltransferase [Flavobacteriaceae bacterium]|nr:glycosyltransferase [Flavobacteriaceae bacterium]
MLKPVCGLNWSTKQGINKDTWGCNGFIGAKVLAGSVCATFVPPMKNGKQHICLFLNHDPKWHGGTIYIQNLVKALAALPADERSRWYVSIACNPIGEEYAKEVEHLVEKIYVNRLPFLVLNKCFQLMNRLLGGSKVLWPLQNIRKIDFYFPAVSIKGSPFAWAGWIQDFQYKYLPQFFTQEQLTAYQNRFDKVAASADKVVLSSYVCEHDFRHYYPEQKAKSFVLRFVNQFDRTGMENHPKETQEKHSLSDKFFLVCNQFWIHKDHRTIIDALYILKQEGFTPIVACTGGTKDFRNPEFFGELMNYVKEKGVEEQWKILGFISREDQMQLIRRSVAVIQPSLFEGWSTVVEDARCLGKPMLLSDFPVHVEQAPAYSHYFKQQDAAGLAALMKESWQNLQAGPEIERETLALKQNEEAMTAFGRKIVELAKATAG